MSDTFEMRRTFAGWNNVALHDLIRGSRSIREWRPAAHPDVLCYAARSAAVARLILLRREHAIAGGVHGSV